MLFLLFPEVKGWIVGPTYEDGSKEFGYIWDDLAKVGLLRTAKSKHSDVRGGNMRIELKNGSWIQVITANDQENLRREQLDFVIYAEASKLPENLHQQYVYSRVERRRGLVFYPTTHKGHGWVYEDVRVPSLPVRDRTFTWGPWEADRRAMVGGDPNPDYDPEYWSCQVSYVPEFGEVLHRGEYTDEQIAKARARLPAPMFAEQFGGKRRATRASSTRSTARATSGPASRSRRTGRMSWATIMGLAVGATRPPSWLAAMAPTARSTGGAKSTIKTRPRSSRGGAGSRCC